MKLYRQNRHNLIHRYLNNRQIANYVSINKFIFFNIYVLKFRKLSQNGVL